MAKALDLAIEASEKDEVPVGAIIVSGGKIIGKGFNQTEQLNDVTAHAEILAITAATQKIGAKYLKECTLYVTLEPCAMCGGAIFWSQLERIVIGASDQKRGCLKLQPSIIHPKAEIIKGVLEKESEMLLKKFFKELRT